MKLSAIKNLLGGGYTVLVTDSEGRTIAHKQVDELSYYFSVYIDKPALGKDSDILQKFRAEEELLFVFANAGKSIHDDAIKLASMLTELIIENDTSDDVAYILLADGVEVDRFSFDERGLINNGNPIKMSGVKCRMVSHLEAYDINLLTFETQE